MAAQYAPPNSSTSPLARSRARSEALPDPAYRQGAAEMVELHVISTRAAARDGRAISGRLPLQVPDGIAGDLPPALAIVQSDNQIPGAEIITDHRGGDFIDRVFIHGNGIGVRSAIGDAFAAELRRRGLRRTFGAARPEQPGHEAAIAPAMHRRRRGGHDNRR